MYVCMYTHSVRSIPYLCNAVLSSISTYVQCTHDGISQGTSVRTHCIHVMGTVLAVEFTQSELSSQTIVTITEPLEFINVGA